MMPLLSRFLCFSCLALSLSTHLHAQEISEQVSEEATTEAAILEEDNSEENAFFENEPLEDNVIEESEESDTTPENISSDESSEPTLSEYEQKLQDYLGSIHEEDFTSTAKLQALNKITARTHQMDVKVGQAAKFGNLEITLNRCWRAPPTQIPESKALLFIQEKVPGEEVRTVFEGWMFASSPSLSALEHPVYDVRILECIANPKPAEAVKPSE